MSHRQFDRNPAFVTFIKAELESAFVYCQMVEQSELISPARVPSHLKNARKAYEKVVRYTLKATLEGHEFDEITANTERLKFKLEALEARHHGQPRPPRV